MPTGALVVNSDPQGALIMLDGEPKGKTTPATLEGLAPGTYELTVVKDGTERTTAVLVEIGISSS